MLFTATLKRSAKVINQWFTCRKQMYEITTSYIHKFQRNFFSLNQFNWTHIQLKCKKFINMLMAATQTTICKDIFYFLRIFRMYFFETIPFYPNKSMSIIFYGDHKWILFFELSDYNTEPGWLSSGACCG